MDILDFEEGPWTKLIESDFQGFTIYIYQNPKKWILTVIFEKENEQITHIVTQLYAPFKFEGNIYPFDQKIGIDNIIIKKNLEGEQYNYFVVCSGIEYTHYSADEFRAAIKKQVSRLKVATNHVLDVAKKANIDLRAVSTLGKIEQANFFGEPLLMPILATRPNMIPASEKIGEILLGLDNKGNIVKKPATYFSTTIITAKEEKLALRMAQNVSESLLSSAIPVLLFDPNTAFLGLGKSADNKKELEKHHIDMNPTAFPINNVTDYVKIDINELPDVLLAELGGWNIEEMSKEIQQIISENQGKIKDINDIIAMLSNKPNPTYYTRQAIRALTLLEAEQGAYIDGSLDINKLIKPWTGSLGTANIISFTKVNENVRKYMIYSVLKKILSEYTNKGITKKLRLGIVIPNAGKYLGPNSDGYLREIILGLNDYGVAVILLAEEDIDIHSDILDNSNAKINCINNKEAVLTIKGSPPVRFQARPLLSRFFGI